MRAHRLSIGNAPGFLIIAAAILVFVGISTGSQVSGQEAPGAPQQAPAAPGAPPIPEGSFQPIPETSASAPPQAPPTAADATGITCPPEYLPLVQKTTAALMTDDFTFYPIKTMDPFKPFMSLEPTLSTARSQDEGEDEPKEMERPLTPLQKMTMAELERGLKAITWGDLGRKAVIEDSTGKGYIVAVGTPAGERNGVITHIFNDRLVIQQEIWDRQARKRFPQDFTIKLSKRTDKQQ